MKKLLNNKHFIFFVAIILFFFGDLFQLIPISILNINTKNLDINGKLILGLFSSIITISILLILFRNDIKKDVKDFIKNRNKLFDESFKIWCVGLIVMAIFNLTINHFSPNEIANNEEAIRSYISASPIIMIINTAIMAPLLEELVFRKSFRCIFKNKYIFVLVSGIVFGALHVIFSIDNVYEYLYILPYSSLGIALAYMYYKTDNICCPIIMHSIHNAIMTLMNIFLVGMILC